MNRITYTKVCKCDATATVGAIRTTTDYDERHCQTRITVTLHPMPSCDACGKPWRQVRGQRRA